MKLLERRDAYLQTIAQLARERAAAKPLVESIRADDVWERDIPPEWRTAGFVQELTATASSILETDPKNSLALAQLALAIATSIPSDAYPAPIQLQIEGTAWKEIGTAHRYMSEFDASLRAYEAAKRAFDGSNALALDSAVADFARAIVFVELERHDEAVRILEQTDPIFESFGDKKRVIQSKMLRANICAHQQRWKDARTMYAALLPQVPLDDLYTRTAVHQNLGVAHTELGEFDQAFVNLHMARQIFAETGMPIEISRCDWNIARLLMLKNEYRKALPMLEHARAVFLENELPEEAGLAGLDQADASIAVGEIIRARELVARIVTEFTEAKLNERAITALAYLRDILPQTPRPATAVRHVRTYLDRLQKEPALLFLPLPE